MAKNGDSTIVRLKKTLSFNEKSAASFLEIL